MQWGWKNLNNIIDKLMNTAYSQLGVKEYPKNSNNVKYNTEFYGRNVSGNFPWCCTFVWWVFRHADLADLFCNGIKTAYCPYVQTWAKQNGLFSNEGERGDIVLFNFSDRNVTASSVSQHIGIVSKKIDSQTYLTIEGNTGTHSEANGGEVMERTRKKANIVGFVNLQKKYKYVEELKIMEQLRKDVESLKKDIINLNEQLTKLKKEEVYNWTSACPMWSQPYVHKALELGIIKGDTQGNLNLTDTKIWSLVVMMRALKIME